MTHDHTAHSSNGPDPSSQGATGQDWLRQLDWRQFEELVGAAYRLQGYTVLPTSPGADGGIDLILTRGDERIFVQCKHWKAWQVGAPVVRELFGLVAAHRATRGIVVTSGTFSREAVEFARQTSTDLLDGPAVLALVASGNAHRPVSYGFTGSWAPPDGPRFVAHDTTPPGTPGCPVCLAPMVLHKARRGAAAGAPFWGCSRYPGCRGTIEAAPGTRLPSTPRQLARQRRDRRKLVVGLVALALGLFFTLPIGAVVLGSVLRGAASAPTRLAPPVPMATPSTPASPVESGMPGMGEQPMDIAVDRSGETLYTANYVSGDVTVIDAGSMTVVDTIDVPGKPVGIAVGGASLYVADRAGKKVYAINLKTREMTSTYATARGPSDLAVDATARRLFIAHDDGTIRTYALDTGRRLPDLEVSAGISIAVDTGEHKLYADASGGVLYTYRVETLERTGVRIVIGGGAAVDSKRQRLYVAHGSGLREYNLLTGSSRSFAVEIDARSVAVDPATRTAFVADPDASQVQAVSLR